MLFFLIISLLRFCRGRKNCPYGKTDRKVTTITLHPQIFFVFYT